MPRIADDLDIEFNDPDSEGSTEVAPIGESLGEVPVIQDLDAILDPLAPAPTNHSYTEQEGHPNGTH